MTCSRIDCISLPGRRRLWDGLAGPYTVIEHNRYVEGYDYDVTKRLRYYDLPSVSSK